MFNWAILFLVLAIVAGVFGFTGIAVEAAFFAKVVFFLAVASSVVTFVLGRRAGFSR